MDKFTNREIHEVICAYPKTFFEYNYLLNKFGTNKIELDMKPFIFIYLEQISNPLYIYQVKSLHNYIK